jgi:hypothetical protein
LNHCVLAHTFGPYMRRSLLYTPKPVAAAFNTGRSLNSISKHSRTTH